jgi:hypothetical protein
MNEQKASEVAAEESGSAKRQRSAIAFPYNDFDDAASIAEKIHSNVGNGICSLGQLAVWSGMSIKSSGFRVQIAASRLFGLIESDNADSYRLTSLGRQLADPHSSRKAKVEAFLSVPLFDAIYKNHKDGVLPPVTALEREIVGLGVSEKQKERARQVFERSALQTGFFEHGKNRLVTPALRTVDPPPAASPDVGEGSGNRSASNGSSGGDGEFSVLDPLLLALLRKIPSLDEGWPREKRVRWFKTFAMNVSQVYDSDDEPVEITIS